MTETMEMLKIALEQKADGILITFRLQNDDVALAESLIKARINARFAVALVEINDQEQPVPPAPTSEKQKKKQNANVMRAAIVCGEGSFQTFLRKKYSKFWKGALGEGQIQAADALRNILSIDSRKELATEGPALVRFDAVMAEYEMWKRGQ